MIKPRWLFKKIKELDKQHNELLDGLYAEYKEKEAEVDRQHQLAWNALTKRQQDELQEMAAKIQTSLEKDKPSKKYNDLVSQRDNLLALNK